MDRVRRSVIKAAIVALASPASAQVAPRPPRRVAVVLWYSNAPDPIGPARKFWAEALARNGYVDGKDVEVVVHRPKSDGPQEELALAQRVVAERPDVIVVPGGDAIARFKRLTRTIPVVFFNFGADPVRLGLVDSYRRPGGNITGTTNQGIEMVSKIWGVVKELVPSARRLGVLWDETRSKGGYAPQLRDTLAELARRSDAQPVHIVVAGSSAFSEVEAAITSAKVDALLMVAGNWPWAGELMKFLERARIPAEWELPSTVRQGGLMSLHGSYDEAVRMTAVIVARILAGANPADIPIHEVTKIDFAINLRTARAMNLTVPQSVLLQATLIVE